MDMTWVVLCYAAMQEALHALTNDASLHNLTHPWYFVANSIGIAYFIRVGRVLYTVSQKKRPTLKLCNFVKS